MTYVQMLSKFIHLDPQLFLRSFHIYMLVFWLPFAEVSRIIIRYGKITIPLHINIHSIMMVMLSLFTFMYVGLYFGLFGLQFDTPLNIVRTILIFVLLILILIQITLGTIIRMLLFSINFNSGFQAVKETHKWLGYLTIILSRAIISLVFLEYNINNPGEKTTQQERMKAWFFVLGSVYFLLIILQFLYRSVIPVFIKRNLDKTNIIPPQFSEQSPYYQIAQMINKGASLYAVFSHYPQARFVIFNNRLYQIQDLIHPGGQNIVQEVLGQQINYLISGGHSTQINPQRHSHTIYVYRYFANKPSILLNSEKFLLKKDFLQQTDETFKIKDIQIFEGSDSALLQFQSQNIHLKTYYQKLVEFGKYFLLQAYTENYETTKRPYSMILSMTEENINYREYLKELNKNKNNITFVDNIQQKQFSNSVPLIIKYYEGGALTTIVKNVPSTQYKISGPFGKGLQLNQNFEGSIIIITGGTGILPFLDLFDYMYKTALLRSLSKVLGTQQVQKLNPLDINYSMLSNISVKLYASFKTKEEFYGQSLILDLYSMSKENGNNLFDLELRFTQGDYFQQGVKVRRDHIRKNTMKDIISESANRIYVCGTPAMNSQIKQLFLELGGEKDILYLL